MKKVYFGIVGIISLMMFDGKVFAAEKPDYNVEVRLPNNQMKKSINYWWLKVKPKMHQKLSLTISNQSKVIKKFSVSANPAFTNANMTIDYSKSNKQAKMALTGNQPFLISDISNVNNTGKNFQHIEIEPGYSKKINVGIQVPKRPFEGLVLGGINVTEVAPTFRSNQAINNLFGYTYAVVLQESRKVPAAKINVSSVRYDTKNQQFMFDVTNRTNSLAQKVAVQAKIMDVRGDVVASYKNKNATIVPQGIVHLSLSNDNLKVRPGNRYKFKATVSGGNFKKVTTTQNFKVK